MRYSGFSLVELSIVLVILGLLTGGILTGQNLIRAAELRSVAMELQNYMTAVRTFQDKYFSVPGDMPNATRFWGDSNTHCADVAITDGATCNGDGDGIMDKPPSASTEGEIFLFWNHLALAGLIEGSYSGVAGTANNTHVIYEENIPPSKLPNAGWVVWESDESAGASGSDYAIDFNNHLLFGAPWPVTGFGAPVLKAEEAWNIDNKIDDGRPAYGKIIARGWNNTCAAASDGTHSATDFDAEYKLADTSVQCALRVRNIF